MAAYTTGQAQKIIEQYKPAIIGRVKRYHNQSLPMISDEDLFQDVVEAILRYLKTLDSNEPFVFPKNTVQSAILKGRHDALPLSYSKVKNEYAKRLQDAKPTLEIRENQLADRDLWSDVDYQIDYQNFRSKLSEKERSLIDLIMNGYTPIEAAGIMNLPVSSSYYLRDRIRKKYEQMMR